MKEIIVPEGVTEIKSKYFDRTVKLQSLKLPLSIRTIENGTFTKMGLLKKLECPVQHLNHFRGIEFTTYIIPNKTTDIPRDALKDCLKERVKIQNWKFQIGNLDKKRLPYGSFCQKLRSNF